MSSAPPPTEPSGFDVTQEDDRIAAQKVSAVLVVGVVVTVAAIAVTSLILSSARAALPTHAATTAPVAPRQIAAIHQTLIERDRHGWEQRDEQRRSLDEYGWVSKERGMARIPIDQAMQIVIDDAARQRVAP